MCFRLLAAFLLSLALTAASKAAVSEVGSGFEVESYALQLVPDLSTKSVSGAETIRFRSLRNGLRSLSFSPNALIVEKATLDGRPVRTDSGKGSVTFELPVAVDSGRSATLAFRYRGVPTRGVKASATSMYTSYFACDWMICLQDAPGDKARFSLDLRLPRGLTSLSIGRLAATVPGADGMVVHKWRSRRSYSPYLFGFAFGSFEKAIVRSGGIQLAYLGEGVQQAELKRLFAETPAMVRFLSVKAGFGLPADQYTQLLVPGREAQEVATYSLIGREELDRSSSDPQSDWVIVHELAHQWWGNSVTSASWKDFWLNEGITTFMTAAWKEHRFGRRAYEAELDGARARLARAGEAGWDRPLAFGGEYPSLGLRRAVQYSKGALFMHELRNMLGERAFWAGLKAYTRRHAGGTVTSIDLQRAMEQESGRSLSGEFGEWVFGSDPGTR